MVAFGKFKPNSRIVSHVDLGARELVIIAWVLEFELKLVGYVEHKDFHVCLGKSFTEADTAASMEGNPAHWVTLFAAGCQA